MKKILDVTCGSRSIWYDKKHPLAVYCDIRKERYEGDDGNPQRGRLYIYKPKISHNIYIHSLGGSR